MLSGMQGLKLLLAPIAWKFFEKTVRLDSFEPPLDTNTKPVIYTSLHRDLLPAIMYLKPTKVAIVISNSPDGDILVHTLGSKNYNFVRGATGSDGSRAFAGMRRMLKVGISVGIAVDGPEGPYGTIHDGAFRLSKITGCSIIPLKAEASHAFVLNSWDRTIVPLPFTKVSMHYGNPIQVPETADNFQSQHQELADFYGEGNKIE